MSDLEFSLPYASNHPSSRPIWASRAQICSHQDGGRVARFVSKVVETQMLMTSLPVNGPGVATPHKIEVKLATYTLKGNHSGRLCESILLLLL